MSCSFEKTKVWEVPGKDYYNDVDFESNPEVAVQLWYDYNGTWLLRESKLLVAYLHLDDMTSESKDALERSRLVLTKLLTKVIRSRRTLMERVYSVFDKEDWVTQRKWQEDNCIEDSEMLHYLRWLDDNGSDIHDNSFEYISRDFDKAWTDSLVGRLKVKVPGRGVFILDGVDNSNTIGGRCICKYDLVEIAWMVFDRDMKCIESKQYLLKPHGYDKIAQKATSVHGITTERAVKYGVDSHCVFDEFIAIAKQLPNNGNVIAIVWDTNHEDSIFKCNLNKEQQVLWRDAPKCDTWDIKLFKYLPRSAWEKYKTRTLGVHLVELYGVVHPNKRR